MRDGLLVTEAKVRSADALFDARLVASGKRLRLLLLHEAGQLDGFASECRSGRGVALRLACCSLTTRHRGSSRWRHLMATNQAQPDGCRSCTSSPT